MKRVVPIAAVALAVAGTLASCGGRATSPQLVTGGDAARGKQLIQHYGCGGCHQIGGIAHANGRVGLTLENFRDKRFIAGKLHNTPQDVERWVMHPQKILPGNLMPDLGVTNADARNIAAYLYTQ